MTPLICIFIGILAGMAGGLLGIGGGAIMTPLLILFFGLSQHQAQGTTLATLLAPVFILAVMKYHQSGNVNIQMAIFMAVGLAAGAWFGAHFAQSVSSETLKKFFGVFLIVMGIKMFLK